MSSSESQQDSNHEYTKDQKHLSSGLFKESSAANLWSHRLRFFDRITLTIKLISCMLVLLIIGTLGISLAIKQMAGTYLQQKTDTQLIRQAKLGIRNATLLSQEDLSHHGLSPTDYFLQIRDSDMRIISQNLNPATVNGILSIPSLPEDGQRSDIQLGVPFTTPSQVSIAGGNKVDREGLSRAQAPWRVVAMRWDLTAADGENTASGLLFLGLSLGDQMDTMNALTRYCWIVGILIVSLGAVIAALLIQSTLAPLKRIEKIAAKIAAGDLSRRIPEAPVNTEVGSLSASLNQMLSRIEHSFREEEKTTEEMKQFVSDASHELRTPLAAIHGYAELYRMQRDSPGALERADKSIAHIESSSARMADLVQDLLSLTRLDQGRGINVTEDVNVTSLITDATDDLHAMDPQRAVSLGPVILRTEADKDDSSGGTFVVGSGPLPSIHMVADSTCLRQVVTNIVGNVHQYTPSDTPVQIGLGLVQADFDAYKLLSMPSIQDSLEIFIHSIQSDLPSQERRTVKAEGKIRNFVVMSFVDHGPGVHSEHLPRLFKRFYTADSSRTREKGGTGMGLAIVESIVRGHGGLICASITPGGGLTFTVVLPQEQDS